MLMIWGLRRGGGPSPCFRCACLSFVGVLSVRIVHSFVLSACLLVSFALKLFFVEDMYVIL